MSLEIPVRLNDQISEEAAQWLVELRTGDIDAAGLQDFDAWLRASPAHIRAFIEMAALWHEGGTIDPRRQLDVESIICRAQAEDNITGLAPAKGGGAAVPMIDHLPPRSAARTVGADASGPRARAVRWAIAASLLVALMAAALILHSGLARPLTYATAVGARQSIVLPDGSQVLLDSKSRLRVSYTAAARMVELLQGQALFHVVRNPQR